MNLKQKLLFTFAIILLTVSLAGNAYLGIRVFNSSPSRTGEIQVYFSPKGGCTDAIVAALGKARKSVYGSAYSFTSKPIADALIAADARKVETFAVLDKSQRNESISSVDEIEVGGVATFIDTQHAIFHNKFFVIDESIVITGSFNFSKAAEDRNAENMLVIYDPELAKKYIANWKLHQQHAVVYKYESAEGVKK